MQILILILNITGTFLLSVEAIKLKNLRVLIGSLNKSNRILNPRIHWVENEVKDKDEGNEVRKNSHYGASIFFMIVVLVFIIPSYLIIQFFLPSLNIILLVSISIFGSFILWTAVIYFIELIIVILNFIESNTKEGIIGIMGFLLLVVSFVFQYYLNTN